MLDHYSIEQITCRKIAEEREAAARYWLSVKVDRAQREALGAAESPLAGLLRMLASAFGFRRPAPRATITGQHAQ